MDRCGWSSGGESCGESTGPAPPAARLGGGGGVGSSMACPAAVVFGVSSMSWQWILGAYPCLNSSFRPRRRSGGHPHSQTATLVHLRRLRCAFLTHVKSYFYHFRICLCRRLCSDTHDSAALVFRRRQNNERLSHPFMTEGSQSSLIARVCRRAVAKQNGLR